MASESFAQFQFDTSIQYQPKISGNMTSGTVVANSYINFTNNFSSLNRYNGGLSLDVTDELWILPASTGFYRFYFQIDLPQGLSSGISFRADIKDSTGTTLSSITTTIPNAGVLANPGQYSVCTDVDVSTAERKVGLFLSNGFSTLNTGSFFSIDKVSS